MGAVHWDGKSHKPLTFFFWGPSVNQRGNRRAIQPVPQRDVPESGDRALRPDWGMLRRSFPPRKAHSGGGGRVWFVYQPASLNNRREKTIMWVLKPPLARQLGTQEAGSACAVGSAGRSAACRASCPPGTRGTPFYTQCLGARHRGQQSSCRVSGPASLAASRVCDHDF